jgi:hypothetical protein
MIICLNYTFSVPDKRLQTLYKGITVTPRVVQASSVSSYGRNTFTRDPLVSASYGAPTFGAETTRDLALVASRLSGHLARVASSPGPRCTQRVALLALPNLRRRNATVRAFGTEVQHCSDGLHLHNKTHITQAALVFPLNHQCKTSPI